MKKTLRDYLPILMMLLCAAGFGALLLTGVIDLNTVPQLVEHRPVLAVLVILALFIAKGFSGVVVYNALVVVVSLILPLPAALAISGVGTALCLSISYWMGRSHPHRQPGGPAEQAPQAEQILHRHSAVWLCLLLHHPHAGAEHGAAGRAVRHDAAELLDLSVCLVAVYRAGYGVSVHSGQ